MVTAGEDRDDRRMKRITTVMAVMNTLTTIASLHALVRQSDAKPTPRAVKAGIILDAAGDIGSKASAYLRQHYPISVVESSRIVDQCANASFTKNRY